MAVSFTRFSCWLWGGGKEKEPVHNGSSLNSSSEWGFGHDTVKFPPVKGSNMPSSSKEVKKKWKDREERRNEGEYDAVLVPSEIECVSGLESDGLDWSVGWFEPHGPDFQSNDESDDSFAVLVPCYRPGCKELSKGSDNQLLSAIKNLPNGFSPEGKNYMEQWLSSLQNTDARI